jgi:hypothetical protein
MADELSNIVRMVRTRIELDEDQLILWGSSRRLFSPSIAQSKSTWPIFYVPDSIVGLGVDVIISKVVAPIQYLLPDLGLPSFADIPPTPPSFRKLPRLDSLISSTCQFPHHVELSRYAHESHATCGCFAVVLNEASRFRRDGRDGE